MKTKKRALLIRIRTICGCSRMLDDWQKDFEKPPQVIRIPGGGGWFRTFEFRDTWEDTPDACILEYREVL